MTFLLNSISWVLGQLPLRMVHALGAGMGFIAWGCSRRKAEIRSRIMDCLGVDREEAKRILRGMYRNLGYTVSEFFRMPHMSDSEVTRRMVFHHQERLPEKGTGFIALVAHTGNWELPAASAPLYGIDTLHMVVKALKPATLNQWVCKNRSRWGTRIHDRRGSSRELIKVVRSHEPLVFVLDQNMKRNWGIFVDFFGKPACTSDGLAQLSAISGYPIYPVFCRRNPEDRKLVVEVGEGIPGPVDRSEEEIARVTALCTKEIENFVRKYPDQWIWMHRRWRTKQAENPP